MIFRNQREGFDTLLNSLSVGSKHAFFLFSLVFLLAHIKKEQVICVYECGAHNYLGEVKESDVNINNVGKGGTKETTNKTKTKSKNKILNLVSAAIEIPFLCVSRLESRCLITHGRTVSILIETC